MISISHGFLFVHVGKNGGNTISSVLAPYADDRIYRAADHQDGVDRFEVANPRYGIRKHAGLREYRDALPPDLYARLFKFAVVRNPWDRMISVHLSPNRIAQGKASPGRVDPEHFCRLVRRQRTFRQFVKTDDGGNLCDELDEVLRFENLADDLRGVCDRIGLPPREVPHLNRGGRDRNYRAYYDAEMRKRVEEKFSEEIAYFGYTF